MEGTVRKKLFGVIAPVRIYGFLYVTTKKMRF